MRLINAPSELLAARVREVAVFPAAQIAVAVGEVESLPDPLAHPGVEVNGEKLIGHRYLVLDGNQLGRLVVDQRVEARLTAGARKDLAVGRQLKRVVAPDARGRLLGRLDVENPAI